MDMDRTIVLHEDTIFQEVDDESVLLNLAQSKYFGLDEVGTRIWQLAREQVTVRAVFEHMLSEYDVDPERLEADLEQLLLDLQKGGLVTLEPGDR